MTLVDAAPAPARPMDYLAPILDLGLESYVRQLDAVGYAVIPPDLVAPAEFIDRVREAILRVAFQRTGIEHVLERNGGHGSYRTDSSRTTASIYTLFYLLFEDPVFEEWLENPTMTAIVNYCLNGQAHLSNYNAFVKWRDPDGDPMKWTVGLHSDFPTGPDGKLLRDWTVNCALCLTEYTKDNGAIWVAPGYQDRQPGPGEGEAEAIPVEAPVGSLIFFKTWHGSRAKITDGLRVTLTTFFSNRLLKPIDKYQDAVPRWILDRRSEQFARYVGADDSSGCGISGPIKNRFGHTSIY